MNLKGAILLLITICFTVSGQLLMKKGVMENVDLSIRTIFANPWLPIGAACYVISFVFWLSVLKIVPLSIAYPSGSISYVLIVFASIPILNEALSGNKVIGILLICGGVFFVSRG